MRLFAAALAVVFWPHIAAAAEGATEAVAASIERGAAFLAKDAVAWKTEHNCVSCHHASLIVWSLREANERGHAIDRSVLVDLTNWIVETGGDGTTGLPRPESAPRALNEKAVSLLWGLGAVDRADKKQLGASERLLKTVLGDQLDDGSWASWPETRPPIFGNSDERATAAAVLSLLPAANSGNEQAKAARERAVGWLAAKKTDDDPQSIALRLIIWRRLGRSQEDCQPLIERISAAQNADGGWSQSAEIPSDSWATGQSLYALAEAGIARDDPRIVRGQTFLIKTQREDGSWPMLSRPTKPGGEGSTSLIPIIGAGSAWAVLGLVRSS